MEEVLFFFPSSYELTGVLGSILATLTFLQPKELSKIRLPRED